MDLRRIIDLFRTPLHAIIIINVMVTVVIYCAAAIYQATSSASAINPAAWLAMPSNLGAVVSRPWTIITYMFTQVGLIHLICNMLWLWMFGRMYNIARGRLPESSLWLLYILGGLSGALAFLAICNLTNTASTVLIGSSAATLAVIAFTAIRIPDFRINLVIFGMVKLKWIAVAALVFFILMNLTTSLPAAAAHIGGAVFGVVSVMIVKKRSTRRPVYKPQTAGNTLSNNAELDKLLEKVSASGYASLSASERKRLIELSKKA